MKTAFKKVLNATGALRVLRHVTAPGRVDIMLYHGFCERPPDDGRLARFMPIGQFERQIQLIADCGKPLRLSDLLRGEPVDGVVVTLDDGYANNYHLAFPVLKKYGIRATIFITTGFVDRTTPLWRDWLEFLIFSASKRDRSFEWADECIALALSDQEATARTFADMKRRLRTMSITDAHALLRKLETVLDVSYEWDQIPEPLRPLRWNDIHEMKQSGLVSFGSHTVSHPVLSMCSESEQWSEIARAHRRLEAELGEECPAFAYPYGQSGDYTDLTKGFASKAGASMALSAESGFNTPDTDRHALRRWGADITSEEMSFIIAGGPVVSRLFSFGQPH